MEVLRRIKADERTKTIPVVILTSSKEERDLINGYGLGANSCIQKPVDFDQFRDTIKNVGLYWLVINQAPVSQGLSRPRQRWRAPSNSDGRRHDRELGRVLVLADDMTMKSVS